MGGLPIGSTTRVAHVFLHFNVISFVPSCQCRAEATAHRRAKKNGRVCTLQDAQQVLVVPDPSHADSSAEYVPPRHVPGGDGSAQRILPMQSAKLHRRIVFHGEYSSEPAGDNRLDIGGSPIGTNSGSESGSGSGSDAWDFYATSSGFTVSSSDPGTAAPAPPPRKKFRWTAPRSAHSLSQQSALAVVAVDGASG